MATAVLSVPGHTIMEVHGSDGNGRHHGCYQQCARCNETMRKNWVCRPFDHPSLPKFMQPAIEWCEMLRMVNRGVQYRRST